jgi:galactitol-specific phosphotransferase system IIB component
MQMSMFVNTNTAEVYARVAATATAELAATYARADVIAATKAIADYARRIATDTRATGLGEDTP